MKRSWLFVGLAMLSPGAALGAQGPAHVAESYDAVFDELRDLAEVQDRVAQVHGLTLKRDAASFVFTEGHFYVLSPIAGRDVAVAFVGDDRPRIGGPRPSRSLGCEPPRLDVPLARA